MHRLSTTAQNFPLIADLTLLRTVFRNTANPLHLLVLRKGATSELGSVISTEASAILRVKAGVAVDHAGRAPASAEVINVANLPSVDYPKGMNVTVRGPADRLSMARLVSPARLLCWSRPIR